MSKYAAEKINELHELISHISRAVETIVREWKAAERNPSADSLPSQNFYDASRIMQAACGMCTNLVQDPVESLVSAIYANALARSMYIAVQGHVAEALAEGDPIEGVAIGRISQRVDIPSQKLAQVLQCLCAAHIFSEVKPGFYANNETSQILVGNEPVRQYLLLLGMREVYSAVGKLPDVFFDPNKNKSTSATESAFQEVLRAPITLFKIFERGDQRPDGTWEPLPELKIWTLSMAGFGQMIARSICAAYPWESLGSATVVDVGGGVGSMCLELAKYFPKLRFVVEDLDWVIADAQIFWEDEFPEALATGRTELVAHNFFMEQPRGDAEVYVLRNVLNDWPDDECVKILSRLKHSLKSNARVLVAELMLHPASERAVAASTKFRASTPVQELGRCTNARVV